MNAVKINLNDVKIRLDLSGATNYGMGMADDAKQGARAPRGYHHGDLRAALVAAARVILEEEGLDDLSLRAVARRAGVSQAAPYHHFADKSALLSAVAAQGFAELEAAMRQPMAGLAAADERLDAAGLGYVLFAVANPALFRLMFSGGKAASGGDAALAKAGEGAYAVLEEAVAARDAAAGATEAPGITRTTAWALVHGLAKLVLEAGLDPREQGARDVEDLERRVLARMRWP
jgi:AcrR family transcriptional regulator